MNRLAKRVFVITSAVAILLVAGIAHSAPMTVIDDHFNASWTVRPGTAPDTVNLPGGTWIKTAGYSTYNPNTAPSGWGSLNSGSLLMSGSGSDSGGGVTNVGLAAVLTGYKPTTISADIKFLWGSGGGVAIGFYSATLPAANTAGVGHLTGFTGINVARDGTLTVYENGTAGTSVSTGNSASWTLRTLSYDINTTTGAISNITFAGLSVSGLTSTAFTSSATVYAAAVASGNSTQPALDNFKVMGVEIPEPATLALLTLGAMTMVGIRRRS